MSLGRTVLVSDNSITSLSGSSQQLLPQDMTRSFMAIVNIGADNIGVNLAGGTAAIAGTGTITIVPNGSLIIEGSGATPGNQVNIIGTSGQPVCCLTSG